MGLLLSTHSKDDDLSDDPLSDASTQKSMMRSLISDVLQGAYEKTVSLKPEKIQELFLKSEDITKVTAYKSMSREQLWITCTKKLTETIQCIIEFCKLFPNFMQLPKDDQISLIKYRAFDLAVIQISRYIDPSTGKILVNNKFMLPQEAFYKGNAAEVELIKSFFQVAESIAKLYLTDGQLGFLSAFVLLNANSSEFKLIEAHSVRKINNLVDDTIRHDLDMMSTIGDMTLYHIFVKKMFELRKIAQLHKKVVKGIEHLPFVKNLPPLYREIFLNDDFIPSVDDTTTSVESS